MTLLRVHSTGTTYQGTGHLHGFRQFFVRLQGCSIKDCNLRSVCDEPSSLNSGGGTLFEPEDLVEKAREAVGPGGWVHVTGGEPADQAEAVGDLAFACNQAGMMLHLQTSGRTRMDLQWDWLTVSPKGDQCEQTYGQEMVLVYDGHSPERLLALLKENHFWYWYCCPKMLPGGSTNAAEAVAAVEQANELLSSEGPRHRWAMTVQAHKTWGIA
jgi:organic radical activating enzyme